MNVALSMHSRTVEVHGRKWQDHCQYEAVESWVRSTRTKGLKQGLVARACMHAHSCPGQRQTPTLRAATATAAGRAVLAGRAPPLPGNRAWQFLFRSGTATPPPAVVPTVNVRLVAGRERGLPVRSRHDEGKHGTGCAQQRVGGRQHGKGARCAYLNRLPGVSAGCVSMKVNKCDHQ